MKKFYQSEICSSSAFPKNREDEIQVGGQIWSESDLH